MKINEPFISSSSVNDFTECVFQPLQDKCYPSFGSWRGLGYISPSRNLCFDVQTRPPINGN